MTIEDKTCGKKEETPRCIISVAQLFGDPEDIFREQVREDDKAYDAMKYDRRYGK